MSLAKSRTGQVEVTRDADHGQPGCPRSVANAELRSQRVSIGPEPPRERFADDELTLRVNACRIERSSLQQPHPGDAKVSGSDERRFAELQIDRLRARRSLDGERASSYRCQQQRARKPPIAASANAWRCRDGAHERLLNGVAIGRRWRVRKMDADVDESGRIIPDPRALERDERSYQETCRDEKDDGQRHFGHDHAAAEPSCRTASHCASDAGTKRVAHRLPAGEERGRNTE